MNLEIKKSILSFFYSNLFTYVMCNRNLVLEAFTIIRYTALSIIIEKREKKKISLASCGL